MTKHQLTRSMARTGRGLHVRLSGCGPALRAAAIWFGIISFPATAFGQLREYEIHRRGMVHETVYNTGEIGRPYHQGHASNRTAVPLMEWPGYSATIAYSPNARAEVQYDGRHHILGGGMYMAGEAADTTQRMYVFSGGAGSSQPEHILGVYVYPEEIYRIENFPVLENGDLNPSYDPDEAEEIIVARWGTTMGVTITRTSRVWSYPDYDDMIIYEYELEHTGNRDGNPNTVQSTETLHDVLIGFAYGFAPNMFAYQRHFDRWFYSDFEGSAQRGRFDRSRWLKYVIDNDGKPDPHQYGPWSSTGRNGGGLLAPGAAGFSMLYYDTEHLTRRGEIHDFLAGIVLNADSVIWDANDRIKQPWTNRQETSNTRIDKIQTQMTLTSRRNPPYRNLEAFGEDWVGRGSFNVRQSMWATGHIMYFGPYTLEHGQKVRFSLAQVIGYGAARVEETRAGLVDEGGSCGQWCAEESRFAFYPVPNWTEPVTYGGPDGSFATYGSDHLSNYDLPDYINSDVVTVREVTDKAIYAYTGQERPEQFWPEHAQATGRYEIPVPVPAPALFVQDTPRQGNELRWGPQVESFSHPRQMGAFSHYEVRVAPHPLGPWTTITTVEPGESAHWNAEDGEYIVEHLDARVGETFYYGVISVDEHGNRSGMTNLQEHVTQIAAVEELGDVYVVPNPFVVNSGYSGGGDAAGRLGFYRLPERATIRIYSYSGQLVEVIEHEGDRYSTAYLQISRNNQLIASGMYFYVVETPDGQTTRGKFVVVR